MKKWIYNKYDKKKLINIISTNDLRQFEYRILICKKYAIKIIILSKLINLKKNTR